MSEPVLFAKTDKGTLAPCENAARELMATMGDGEQVTVTVQRSNNPAFHRKLFAMLNFAYEQWNPAEKRMGGMPAKKSRERFRKRKQLMPRLPRSGLVDANTV